MTQNEPNDSPGTSESPTRHEAIRPTPSYGPLPTSTTGLHPPASEGYVRRFADDWWDRLESLEPDERAEVRRVERERRARGQHDVQMCEPAGVRRECICPCEDCLKNH